MLIYEVTGDNLTLDSKGGGIDNPKTEQTNSLDISLPLGRRRKASEGGTQ